VIKAAKKLECSKGSAAKAEEEFRAAVVRIVRMTGRWSVSLL